MNNFVFNVTFWFHIKSRQIRRIAENIYVFVTSKPVTYGFMLSGFTAFTVKVRESEKAKFWWYNPRMNGIPLNLQFSSQLIINLTTGEVIKNRLALSPNAIVRYVEIFSMCPRYRCISPAMAEKLILEDRKVLVHTSEDERSSLRWEPIDIDQACKESGIELNLKEAKRFYRFCFQQDTFGIYDKLTGRFLKTDSSVIYDEDFNFDYLELCNRSVATLKDMDYLILTHGLRVLGVSSIFKQQTKRCKTWSI